jgi:hypothetical protein
MNSAHERSLFLLFETYVMLRGTIGLTQTDEIHIFPPE